MIDYVDKRSLKIFGCAFPSIISVGMVIVVVVVVCCLKCQVFNVEIWHIFLMLLMQCNINTASHLGSVFMALFSTGSSLTYHLTPFVFNVITTSLPCLLPLVVYPTSIPS